MPNQSTPRTSRTEGLGPRASYQKYLISATRQPNRYRLLSHLADYPVPQPPLQDPDCQCPHLRLSRQVVMPWITPSLARNGTVQPQRQGLPQSDALNREQTLFLETPDASERTRPVGQSSAPGTRTTIRRWRSFATRRIFSRTSAPRASPSSLRSPCIPQDCRATSR
jgi:hypothetical protein